MFNPGDEIWVDNDVIGWPPTRHVVDHVKDNKIIFRDVNSEDYEGCRKHDAHKSLTKALAHAIFEGVDE